MLLLYYQKNKPSAGRSDCTLEVALNKKKQKKNKKKTPSTKRHV